MPVKYWLPLPTRWKLEATLSMKDGTKILLLQRVSVLFFAPLLAGNWVKFQLNEPLSLDYEQSLFFLRSVEQNARDTQMTTRMTEGARRERLFFLLGLPPSFLASRGFDAQRSRARALPLLNPKKRETARSLHFPTLLAFSSSFLLLGMDSS